MKCGLGLGELSALSSTAHADGAPCGPEHLRSHLHTAMRRHMWLCGRLICFPRTGGVMLVEHKTPPPNQATCHPVHACRYYSRARRLHEGARHVVSVLDGTIPSTAVELQKLPGIGPYTAAAIASIVFGEVVGVVDGNVIRVLTRLRGITAEANGQAATTKHLWGLADRLVDPARSGDFNQAVMELGATVCNPKKPRCSECPISAQCRGRKQAVGQADADPVAAVVDDTECTLCKYDPRHPPDIESFPFKKGKKKPTEHDFIVLVVETRGTYLLTQRPKEGLLGGMWEFPNESIESTSDADMKRGLARVAAAVKKLAVTALSPKRWLSHGTVEHIFSHRHHTYHVYTAAVPATRSTSTPHPHTQASAEVDDPPTRWVSVKEFAEAAVSTNMKKVMKKINGEPKRKNASVSKFFKRVKKEH